MPRKRLDRCSRVKQSISFASRLNGGAMRFAESMNERNVLLALEFQGDVIAYNTQPQSFRYQSGRMERRYTPDLLVLRRSNGFCYHEVKTAAGAKSPKFQDKFLRLRHLFQSRLKVPLELLIGPGGIGDARTHNYQRLYPYLAMDPQPARLAMPRALGSDFRFGDALDHLKRQGSDATPLLVLIAHGAVRCDLDTRLGDGSALELATEQLQDG